MNYINLSDLELLEMIEHGNNARRVLSQRSNARLDARVAELNLEIENQQVAIVRMIAHKAKQLPIAQKQIDRVITRMDERMCSIVYEKDNLNYNRMSEGYCGPIGASA